MYLPIKKKFNLHSDSIQNSWQRWDMNSTKNFTGFVEAHTTDMICLSSFLLSIHSKQIFLFDIILWNKVRIQGWIDQFFFSNFLAKWALNCYQVKACFPLPAIDWMASWIRSSFKLSFNMIDTFLKVLKVILPSPSLSNIAKASLLPSSVDPWPWIGK